MAVSVIGNGKREWTPGGLMLFFLLPSLQLLALTTMPPGTIDTLCRYKSIVIIGDAVIGSKQKETVHCRRMLSDTITAGIQMPAVCVSTPPGYPWRTQRLSGSLAGVKPVSHLKVGGFNFLFRLHFYPHIFHCQQL